MIAYYLGIPGSGKTYFAVNEIYNNFSDNKDIKKNLKKDYLNCYTNINEFRFDLVKNVYFLNLDEFYNKLTELYNFFHNKESVVPRKKKNNIDTHGLSLAEIKKLKNASDTDSKKNITDSELIEKAKELNIYKTLIIIDECHNFLDSQDKVKIWWLTYHRHIFQDIYLITQNLQLVHAKYKPLAESFFKAKSQSLTLDKRYFQYMYYTDSRMTRASYVSTNKVKLNQNVFKLYKSGDSVKSKNVVLRFIYISLIMLVILLIVGYSYYHFFVTPEIENAKSSQANHSIVKNIVVDSTDNYDTDSLIFMSFICTDSMCSYKNLYFDIKILSFARDNFNLEIISTRRIFSESLVSVVVDSEFIEFIKGGKDDSFSPDSLFNSHK